MKIIKFLILVTLGLGMCFSQQDAQYTQYMYNTQVVNPGYIGSKDMLSFGLLYRSQWVGFDGAPKTGTFTMSSPIGELKRMGLGLSLVTDKIGPATETNIVGDYAYSLKFANEAKLSFGVKAGFSVLDVDYTKLNIYDPNDPHFSENVDSKINPQLGAGIFYNTEKYYLGLSVPNLLKSKHYNSDYLDDVNLEEYATERLHYFFLAGYVFNLNENLKFKPATMIKFVSGSPLQVDTSANFLINEKFTLGAAYRWDAAITAMAGFQVNEKLFVGLGYDFDTTNIQRYNDGSYEIFIKFDIPNKIEKILTPRFF